MADTAPAGRDTVLSAGGAQERRLPDFFIVGHAKCGTTALHEMLRQHPDIHMPAKEPRFFAMNWIDMGQESAKPRSGVPPETPGKRSHTLAGYLSLFAEARPEQRVGEATPAYLRSSLAASRIASVRPDARIIAILREPTSFLRSFHLQSVRNYNETQKDFQKAMLLEEDRRQGRRIHRSSRTPDDLLYSDHVRYVEQLRRYHAVFPPKQVLVLIYDDFRNDNEGTVRTVLRFLEVDDTCTIEPVETQPSRDLRFQQLHKLVHLRRVIRRNQAVVATLAHTVSALTPRQLRGTVRSRWRRVAFGDPLPPDEEFMLELRCRFKPEVVALSEYLGRDLVSLWGYDRV